MSPAGLPPLYVSAAGEPETWLLNLALRTSAVGLRRHLDALPNADEALVVTSLAESIDALLVGVFLYAGNGVLVTARMLLYPLEPEDLTPPYWVAMGATAISVVAGARIIEMADAPMVAATRGLIAGVSVVFWAFGSWLIPPLIAAGFWRHVVHRVPLRYDPTLRSIIFPLGMYSVAGSFLGQADHLPIVQDVGDTASWFALAAWSVTFAAMLGHAARGWFSGARRA